MMECEKEEEGTQHLSVEGICDFRMSILKKQSEDTALAIGVILLDASWNNRKVPIEKARTFLKQLKSTATAGLECHTFCAHVLIDENDESYSRFLGDNGAKDEKIPPPPQNLPILAVVLQTKEMAHSDIHYVAFENNNMDLIHAIQNCGSNSNNKIASFNRVAHPTQNAIDIMASLYDVPTDVKACSDAIRIFVAGDRSSVGKSSVCLGMLGTLLASGYTADDLAYIKPATQSESTQLVQLYCEQHNITCMAVGPLVYYRGFTRAFLAGETATTDELLDHCRRAVDRVARGKKVVFIDGVGFPAVGSICGTDNASVALACGYPVLDVDGNSKYSKDDNKRKPPGVVLVGGSGVGAAVDAFNLNATYFERLQLPVMGAIFNKIAKTGFYSLENCRKQVTSYFEQSEEQLRKGRIPFGFVPLWNGLAGKEALGRVDEFVTMFREHVNVNLIIQSAIEIKESESAASATSSNIESRPTKIRKLSNNTSSSLPFKNRKDIESKAISAGAAPSA